MLFASLLPKEKILNALLLFVRLINASCTSSKQANGSGISTCVLTNCCLLSANEDKESNNSLTSDVSPSGSGKPSSQELKSCFNQRFRSKISRRPDNVCNGLLSFLARSTDCSTETASGGI